DARLSGPRPGLPLLEQTDAQRTKNSFRGSNPGKALWSHSCRKAPPGIMKKGGVQRLWSASFVPAALALPSHSLKETPLLPCRDVHALPGEVARRIPHKRTSKGFATPPVVRFRPGSGFPPLACFIL